MKRTLYLIIYMLAALSAQAGTKITRRYVQQPLSEVLIDINKAATELNITFIYDKLEDYPVTCSLDGASPMDAIRQVIGFYPVRVLQSGQTVVVEPLYDTERKVVGRVLDEAGEPLEFANITLLSPQDSTILCGGVANASGDFVIPLPEVEAANQPLEGSTLLTPQLLLRASFVGYKTQTRPCTVGNVGDIRLQTDATTLSAVRVQGRTPLARMERGALVYDMPFLLSLMPADDAYEALTRIPGVVETNGNIEFAGQRMTLIINGKATTMDAEQVKERLRQMSADRLAKCEVMMSAPARYHARGSVINIVTRDLYGKHQVSGQLKGAGIFSKRHVGFGSGSLLLAQGKFSLDANYSFKGGEQYGIVEHRAVQPMTTGSWPHYDLTEGFNSFTKHSVYAQMEFALAPRHRLGLTYNGQWQESRNQNVSEGTSPSEQHSTKNNRVNNVDLSYETPFGLKLGASYMNFRYPQTQFLNTLLSSSRQSFYSDSGQDIDKWNITADQSHTLPGDWTLSYGAEMKLTKHESWQKTWSPTGQSIDEASGHVDYTERIGSLYASLAREWKKVSVEAGAQAENYHTPQWDEWRIYPTLNLLWKAAPRSTINLSFSSNTKYPDYWSLMKNVFYSSSYSEIWGNPDLRPQSSYDASLVWQFRRDYTLTAFYTYDDHFFVQLPFQPSDRMAVVMQEVNFNYRQNAGLAASAQWHLGYWANGSAMAAVIYSRDKSDHFHDIPFDRRDLSGRLAATAAFQPFAGKGQQQKQEGSPLKWQSRFSLQSLTLILQPTYQFATIQGVYDIHPFFSLDASVRWTDRTGRLSVVLAGQNLTNFHFQTTDTWRGQNFSMSVWQEWRTIQFALTYRLGNYKAQQHKQLDTSRMGH